MSKLGPQGYGEDNLYDYAFVSEDPVESPLFVLVRDLEDFVVKYLEEVLLFFYITGFNEYLTEPIPIYQGYDCIYPPIVNSDFVHVKLFMIYL